CVVKPTINLNISEWSAHIGDWVDNGDGPISFYWELKDADHNVIESGTNNTPSGEGVYIGYHYLQVTARTANSADTIVDSRVLRKHIGIGDEFGWWCPSLDDEAVGGTTLNNLGSEKNASGTLVYFDDPASAWV